MTDNICPHCGFRLKENAISCPECGSDINTGWSDQASADWLLPDYEEIIQNEFGAPKKNNLMIIIISIALLLALILALVISLF